MKELTERINATKNEIALVHKGVYEENAMAICFGDALLKQIAWNVRRIKTMLETEEKSKNSTSSSNNFLQVYNNKNFFERIVSFFKGLFK